MSKSDEENYFDLIDNTFSAIDDKESKFGVQSLTPEERTIFFVWSALGVLENGSFQYFFENGLDSEATAQSFQDLGFSAKSECFRLAQSLLPDNFLNLDQDAQFEILEQHESSLDELAKKVLADSKQTELFLAKYIKQYPTLLRISKKGKHS